MLSRLIKKKRSIKKLKLGISEEAIMIGVVQIPQNHIICIKELKRKYMCR